MIPNDKAKAYIDTFPKIELTETSFQGFSKAYEDLGLIISGLLENKSGDYYNNTYWKETYTKNFSKDPLLNPWTTEEGQKLALLLFGKIRAPFIEDIWNMQNSLPYQTGYDRRSFRKKPDEGFIDTKITILQHLYLSGHYSGFGSMPLTKQMQYDVYYQRQKNTYIYALALEKEDYNELITDIVNNEDEIGGISKGIIKALLLTKNEKYWELVGKLLLAAQRQEGLRQTILECLDETHLGALKYMIQLILDNDLSRFSSVVRAIDTWFGFGWDAPKKTTIKRTLTTAISYMDDESLIEKALQGKDFLEMYVALWVLGLTDADNANKHAMDLILNNNAKNVKLLALFFMHETKRTRNNILTYFEKVVGNDLEIDYWLLLNMPAFELNNNLFEKIKNVAESIPKNGKHITSDVFSWRSYIIEPNYFYEILVNKANEEQLQELSQDIGKLPSNVREQLISKLFPKHYCYGFNELSLIEKIPVNAKTLGWKKSLIHQAVQDRNTSVMATGIKLFQSIGLEQEDLQIIESLLGRKNKQLRKACINLVVAQPEQIVKESTINLLQSKKTAQRFAGLEVITLLDEKQLYQPFVNEQIEAYKERPSLHKNEQVFIDKIAKTNSDIRFSNGFGGAIDYDNLSPLIVPQQKFEPKKFFINLLTKQRLITRFVDEAKTSRAANKLIDIFLENKNHEYQFVGHGGETYKKLLMNGIGYTVDHSEEHSPQELLDSLPLAKLWKNWYKESKLNDYELSAITSHIQFIWNMNRPEKKEFYDITANYIPILSIKLTQEQQHYQFIDSIKMIVDVLINVYSDYKTLLRFKLDLLEDAIATFPEKLKTKTFNSNQYSQIDQHWCDIILQTPYISVHIDTGSKRYWDLTRYVMAQGIAHPKQVSSLKEALVKQPKHYQFPKTTEYQTIPYYHKKIVTSDDVLLDAIFSDQRFFILDSKTEYAWWKKIKLPHEIFKPLKKNLLALELERGELETEATRLIDKLYGVEGMDYLFEVLERLENVDFEDGNPYDKSTTFSRIVKICEPSETDTYQAFEEKIKASKITKKRLFEVACFTTHWTDWIGRYLKITHFESAVWWFHAHISEYANAQKETIISRYSEIPLHQFQQGALDMDWFYIVYEDLGKSNWKILHDASKYISRGYAHRQVKLYSGVLLGQIKITETLKRIEKRSKEHIKALGLIPLSKTNPEKDLLKRYNLLQTFLKESKQFGAQRQQSEKSAVEIGLENLSRNAGYKDSIRFSWSMEAKAAQKIMENPTVKFEDVVVELSINNQGKADLKITKNGKTQKTIPIKYQKEKAIITLKQNKSYLAKQYSRTRLSLETAMVNEDEFFVNELQNIFLHPVVKPMLDKLVFFNKEKGISGFWIDGKLKDASEKTHSLQANDALCIAHSSHLYQNVEWDLYQRYLFQEKIIQPFKQVFRELYIITENEKETATRSERYQGHQIQPKKTIALLRTRGWTVNYEEGLQKVFHKQGFMVQLQAMADWYSPSDVEAPTLEHVVFRAIKSYLSIPLVDINPVLFSETMRDVDLVVSVAHVGGVDPEASHSTMEMRAVLARESARLFKLENITVKERHVLINGTLGDYSIHLGSGKVSKNGLALSIIPVHSQHRGRLFLPFIDDDPKSAEIISKMKLLAEDHKIQDPTVLAQINKA